MRSWNIEVYYSSIVDFIEKYHVTYKTLTREVLVEFIMKTLKIEERSARKVIKRLIFLGYIVEEIIPAKKIIKFIERE